MILRRTYEFGELTRWTEAVGEAARDFRARFTLWPEYLFANEETRKRINLVASNTAERERCWTEDDERPEEIYLQIGVYQSDEDRIFLCTRDDVPSGKFILLFDSDPEGWDEPFPEEDSEPIVDIP